MIEARYLPFEISNFNKLQFEQSFSEPAADTIAEVPQTLPLRKPVSLNDANLKAASIDVEYEMIIEVLKKCNFNKTKAAKLLNIDRKTLYNKMRQYQELSHSQNP